GGGARKVPRRRLRRPARSREWVYQLERAPNLPSNGKPEYPHYASILHAEDAGSNRSPRPSRPAVQPLSVSNEGRDDGRVRRSRCPVAFRRKHDELRQAGPDQQALRTVPAMSRSAQRLPPFYSELRH